MKITTPQKIVLITSGLVSMLVGIATLFAPDFLHATSGITLDSSASLLNETRAPGGAILALSILILSGAFVYRLTLTALLISTILFLSYGMSRLYSMAVDGLPDKELMQVCVFEILIGLLCLFVLERFLKEPQQS